MPRRKTDPEPQGGTIVTRRPETDGRVGGRMEEAGEAETPEALGRGHMRWALQAQDGGDTQRRGWGRLCLQASVALPEHSIVGVTQRQSAP